MFRGRRSVWARAVHKAYPALARVGRTPACRIGRCGVSFIGVSFHFHFFRFLKGLLPCHPALCRLLWPSLASFYWRGSSVRLPRLPPPRPPRLCLPTRGPFPPGPPAALPPLLWFRRP